MAVRRCCLCGAKPPVVSLHSFPSDYVDFNARKFGGTRRLLPGRYPSVNVPNKTVTLLPEYEHTADQMDVVGPPKEISVTMSVRGCCLCGAKPPVVSLHSFPKNKDLLSLWKQMCNYETCDKVSTLTICSQHFLTSDFVDFNARNFGGIRRLLPGRYPSVNVPNKTVTLLPDHEYTADQMDVVEPQVEPQSSTFSTSDIGSYTVCHHEEINSHPPKRRRFLEPRFLSQMTTNDFSTPRKASRNLKLAKECLRKERLKSEALRKRNRRLLNKISKLEEMLERNKSSPSENAADTILDVVPEGMKDIFARKIRNKKRTPYPPELKTFALSLHCYSPKAYDYVRSKWDNLLPSPSTLRAWFSEMKGQPGLTEEAFSVIEDQNSLAKIEDTGQIAAVLVSGSSVDQDLQLAGSQQLSPEQKSTSSPSPTNVLGCNATSCRLVSGSYKSSNESKC